MALVKRRTNTGRLFLVAAIIIVVGGAAFFLVQQFLSPSSDLPDVPSGANRRVITNFNDAILNDARYQELEFYGQNINVNAATDAGNPNPFQ